MALTTNTVLQVKINDNWVSIPSMIGPQGEQGPAGADGPTGPVGPTGSSGFSFIDVTISVADWNGSTTCTKLVPGVTAQNHVIVSAEASSMPVILDSGIYCSGQSAGNLTFTCSSVPSYPVTFEVMYGI